MRAAIVFASPKLGKASNLSSNTLPTGFRVRKVDADEEIYHEIQCDNCGREVADVDDLFLQPPPAA